MTLDDRNYWLFDMDGTLTCAMHDFDQMRRQLRLPAGVPILEALDAMAPDEARQKRQALDDMELKMAEDATAQPGSHALLQQLTDRGARIGIVTRNGREIANVTLDACGLLGFFDADTIISRDCAEPKPDPAGIELALSRWSATPAQAVMVGDYRFDLESGRRASVATVHLDVNGIFEWPELSDVQVSTLEELARHA